MRFFFQFGLALLLSPLSLSRLFVLFGRQQETKRKELLVMSRGAHKNEEMI